MPYHIEHLYIDKADGTTIVAHGGERRAQYFDSGELLIRHPGHLNFFAQALYFTQMSGDRTDGRAIVTRPPIQHTISLSTRIFSPDGLLFTADHVTLADLERFRDLREASHDSWRYEVSGISDPIPDEDGSIRAGKATVRIAVEETTTSQSAGLLVSSSSGTAFKQIFRFDLFRVGQFIAQVTLLNGAISQTAKLQLMDPDGAVVASGNQGLLSFPVTLRSLNRSRDASGKARPWSLEFVPTGRNVLENIVATVTATTRMPVNVLQDRINDLLGPDGNKLSVYGKT
jgi:hypothetical protein